MDVSPLLSMPRNTAYLDPPGLLVFMCKPVLSGAIVAAGALAHRDHQIQEHTYSAVCFWADYLDIDSGWCTDSPHAALPPEMSDWLQHGTCPTKSSNLQNKIRCY